LQSVASRFSFSLGVGGPRALSLVNTTTTITTTNSITNNPPPTTTTNTLSRSLGPAQPALTSADTCSAGEGERNSATAGGGKGGGMHAPALLRSEDEDGGGGLGEGETKAAVCLICKEAFRACRIALFSASGFRGIPCGGGVKADEECGKGGVGGNGGYVLSAGQVHWQLTCALCRAVARGGGGRVGERGLSAQALMQRRSGVHW